MHAAEAGSENLARLLLERGADKDAVNQDGLSALTLAATGGHTGVLQILLDAGARVDMTDPHSRAALTWAAQRGHVTWATLLEKPDPASKSANPDSARAYFLFRPANRLHHPVKSGNVARERGR
jgi:ankyrin repeat protein